MSNVSMDTIIQLAKQRGFIFPGSDIYGGLKNSWDYGPLGVELKNNIKSSWWQRFVNGRLDVVGIDAALIMNPKVWEASGHLATFNDPLVECKNCHSRFRADQIDTGQPCQNCRESGQFTAAKDFNLMFKTFMGVTQDENSTVFLRPETAQAMFVDFAAVQQSSRQRVPFGIAQIGKAFRNEITPGNYIFRTREFEQMEIEYFVQPDAWEEHFDKWLKEMHAWIKHCGIVPDLVHEREVPEDERAHYSARTVDIEFDFPFGRNELYGLAYRGDFDLQNHAKASGQDLAYTDPQSNRKYVPHVVEPTWGVDRTLLAMMLSAYTMEDIGGAKRTVLKFPAWAAPYKAAVLPLSRKTELEKVAKALAEQLGQKCSVDYDITGSIGKRYRRQDEIGTPYCITVDFDSLDDNAVTIRDRDTMEQQRIPLANVAATVRERLDG